MEIGRGVHIGTATNRSHGLLQLPSFHYVLMFTRENRLRLKTIWLDKNTLSLSRTRKGRRSISGEEIPRPKVCSGDGFFPLKLSGVLFVTVQSVRSEAFQRDQRA